MSAEPRLPLESAGIHSRASGAQRYGSGVVWLAAVWLAVVFTPPVRLPNGIPIRLDDVLVCAAGLALVASAAYRGRAYRLRGTGWILVAMSAYIFCVTVLGPPMADLSITLKEFADAARPLKFLILFLAASRLPYDLSRRALIRSLPVVAFVLLAVAFVQFTLLTPASENPIAWFFLKFSELQEWHARSFFGGRPFATFNTPTDLGYHASLVFATALTLKDMPRRGVVMAACITTLILSQARTFIFALPLLLPAYAWVGSRGARKKVAAALGSGLWIAAGAVLMVAVLPYFSGDYAPLSLQTLSAVATGDVEAEQSIAQRLSNLYLVEIALERAPFTGMVSRDLSPETAFDSEYVMVIHRYGVIGLALTLCFYGVAAGNAWRSRRRLPDMAWLALWACALTFLYGMTQGVLVNTRTGSFLFILLGVFRAGLHEVRRSRARWHPRGRREALAAAPRERAGPPLIAGTGTPRENAAH